MLAEVDVCDKVSGWAHLHQIQDALSRKTSARQRHFQGIREGNEVTQMPPLPHCSSYYPILT